MSRPSVRLYAPLLREKCFQCPPRLKGVLGGCDICPPMLSHHRVKFAVNVPPVAVTIAVAVVVSIVVIVLVLISNT
eukprot:5614654-Pyramimonas_sp.AAC.1